MPAEFQKAIDLTLKNCTNTDAYLDDILIVTKGSLDVHKQSCNQFCKKLGGENPAISLNICNLHANKLSGNKTTYKKD